MCPGHAVFLLRPSSIKGCVRWHRSFRLEVCVLRCLFESPAAIISPPAPPYRPSSASSDAPRRPALLHARTHPRRGTQPTPRSRVPIATACRPASLGSQLQSRFVGLSLAKAPQPLWAPPRRCRSTPCHVTGAATGQAAAPNPAHAQGHGQPTHFGREHPRHRHRLDVDPRSITRASHRGRFAAHRHRGQPRTWLARARPRQGRACRCPGCCAEARR